jgi:hypothetical protein
MVAQKTSDLTDSVRSALEQRVMTDQSRAFAQGMDACLSTASEWQREMMDFIANRLAKDGDMIREMMDCKNPADMMEKNAHWVREAAEDYSAEATKMLAIYTKCTADAVQRRR